MTTTRDAVRFQFSDEATLRAAMAAMTGRGRLLSEPTEQGRWRLYDTFDWRLWRRGWRLLGIADGDATVLVLRDTDEQVLARARVGTVPEFAEQIVEPALGAVRDLIEPRRLLPLAELEMRCERAFLCSELDEPLVRCTVANAAAASADGPAGELGWFLTVAPLRGQRKEYARLVAMVTERFGVPSATSVDDAALVGAGLAPGSYGGKTRYPIHRDMRSDTALKVICRTLLTAIRVNVEGMVGDVDVEFLHDFRVAVRTTRSALSALRTCLPAATLARFAAEFRWLQQQTGDGRDLDVWLLALPAYARELPADSAVALEPLRALLSARRTAAYDRIRAAVSTDRFASLLDDWQAFLDAPATSPAEHIDATLPIGEVAAERIYKAYRRLVKDGKAIDTDGPVEPLHALRIRGKKLRYLMGFFAPLYPSARVGPLLPRLKGLQDVLGTLNDLHIQQLGLRGFAHDLHATGDDSVDSVLAIGRLSHVLTMREAETRAGFVRSFKAVAAGKSAAAYGDLFGPAEVAPAAGAGGVWPE